MTTSRHRRLRMVIISAILIALVATTLVALHYHYASTCQLDAAFGVSPTLPIRLGCYL